MRIILGISGSIAAYKSADLANQLTKNGHDVHVVMTESATKFITPLTMQTLSKNPVHVDVMNEPDARRIEHIDLVKSADLILIAPATANIIGKIANGIGDDMLSTIAIVGYNKLFYIAPAMNTNMYENPFVQENIKKMQINGFKFIEPRTTLLACKDVGKGAMASIADIIDIIELGHKPEKI